MTQEENDLLLKVKDLCARLSDGVICQVDNGAAGLEDGKLVEINISKKLAKFDADYYWGDVSIDDVKPYLRSLSSMTEEERNEYRRLCCEEERECYEFGEWTTHIYYHDTVDSIDWLNKNHFDYRGLIPKSLAIEITKENNIYD